MDVPIDTPWRQRLDALERLRPWFRAYFEKNPKWRSALLCVAQYWSDEANDAVHERIVVSTRDVPRWPLANEPWEGPADDEHEVVVAWYQRETVGPFAWDDNSGAVRPFQALCREGASQDFGPADNYTPVALFRADGTFEVVGEVLRPWLDLPWTPLADWMRRDEDGEDSQPPPPVRAPAPATLLSEDWTCLESIVAAPDADGPKQVWADALLQRGEPRGQFIALSLQRPRSQEAAREREALLREHGEAWLGALANVVPMGTADFETGVLTGATAHFDAHTLELAHDSAWWTVRRLHFAGEGPQPLSPQLRSLVELSGLQLRGVAGLDDFSRTDFLERLHAHLVPGEETFDWLGTLELRALRELTLSSPDGQVPETRTRWAWWPRIERLTVLAGPIDTIEREPSPPALAALLERRPPNAKRIAVGWLHPNQRPGGWQLQLSLERPDEATLTCAALGLASSDRARELLLQGLPASVSVLRVLPSRTWQPTRAELDALARATRTSVETGEDP